MGKHQIKYFANFDHGLTDEQIRKARKSYSAQKTNCGKRYDANGNEIKMLMSFSEWLKIWLDSGKFDMRGNKLGQYCMSRFCDIGDYSAGNVFIDMNSNNIKSAQIGRTGSRCDNFKGTTVATNIATGHQIRLDGRKAIEDAGFHQGAVSRCILGKSNSHHGYKFHRIESE